MYKIQFRGVMSPLSLFLSVLFVFSAPVYSEDPAELDDLIVTAGLEPVSSRDIASSVTVITREEIEQRQVKYLADLLRDVPGFAVSQAGGPGTQTQVRVRGAEANHLLVLMDGIRANDPASNDEFQFQYALTSNIERIEIIRGPQSATWGTDALAGVINIIRRKDIDSRYGSATLEYGSFNTLDLGVDGGVSSDRYQLTGGVSHLNTDGTNISREGTEKDGAENTNANAMLDFEATRNLKLGLSGQFVDARTDFDDVDFFTTGLPVDADLVTKAKRKYLRGDASYDQLTSPWSGSFSVNWLDTDNDNFRDGIFDSSTAATSLELRLKASVLFGQKSSQNHRLTIALDRDDVDFKQRGTASPFGDPNQDQSTDVSGYALEYVGKPTESFSWTLSGRLDDFSDFDDVFSWQLAASHHLASGIKLRGSAGTGSKAPTFTERYGFFADFFIGNPGLKPETSKGWELGFETDFKRNDVRLGFAWFDQKLEDEIDGFVYDPDTFSFTARNKEGKSRRRGVELILDGNLTDSFSYAGSYTYTKASETDAFGNTRTEVRRPPHMASLSANYRFASERGNLNLNINYNGSQLDNFFPPPFFGLVQVELESFTLVDFAASWKLTENLELTGRVSNLFDEDYEEILGFTRPGRAIYAGLRGHFQR